MLGDLRREGAPEDPDVERTVYIASTIDGIQWAPWQELRSTDGDRPKTTDGPAIVSFAGKLVMACRSDKSGHIRASWSEDGATWAPFQTVAGSTAGRPALCVFGDELYMGVRSNSNLILEGWLGGPGFETARGDGARAAVTTTSSTPTGLTRGRGRPRSLRGRAVATLTAPPRPHRGGARRRRPSPATTRRRGTR